VTSQKSIVTVRLDSMGRAVSLVGAAAAGWAVAGCGAGGATGAPSAGCGAGVIGCGETAGG
jgi:hypothetical protein